MAVPWSVWDLQDLQYSTKNPGPGPELFVDESRLEVVHRALLHWCKPVKT